MTSENLHRMSKGAEELRRMSADRAALLCYRDSEWYNNEEAAMMEMAHDPPSWDTMSAADAADAAPSSGLYPTDGEHLAYFNISHTPSTYPDSPEVSNTGLSMYQKAELPSFPSTSPTLRSGSYDGGTENSFFGRWDVSKFSEFSNVVEKAKERAKNLKRGTKELISLGSVDNIIVHPRGKSVGNNHYPYMLEYGGYDLKFWGNLEREPQNGHVRVRYAAEAVLEYGIDEAQRRLLDWLSGLGFTLTEERLSNVDLNICVPIPVGELTSLLENKELCVTDVQKDSRWRNHGKVETFYLGSRERTLVKIYDKRVELTSKCDNINKLMLTIQRHIGDEWFNSNRPITRVEFSFGRVTLKGWGINSLADFRAREHSIVDLSTFGWLRILAEPKVRGHENTALLHPHWLSVREEFLRCFDCLTAPLTKVGKKVSLDHKRLGQQLRGILRKLVGFKYGKVESLSEFRQCCCAIIRDKAEQEDVEKLNNWVAAFQSLKNCELGEDEGLEEFKLYDAG